MTAISNKVGKLIDKTCHGENLVLLGTPFLFSQL